MNRHAIRVPITATVPEAARILRFHEQSVTRLYREGILDGGRIGKRLFLRGDSIAAYLNERGIPAEVVAE